MNTNRIAALIITYNPEIDRLEQNIASIKSQVEEVLLVDNGSKNVERIKSIIGDLFSVSCLFLPSNCGIAAALNVGMDNLMLRGYNWVLTLDQDSIAPPNMISSFSRYLDHGKVGIIAPAINYSDDPDDKIVLQDTIEETYACMTSASLTKVEAWAKVGGFDVSFFIDFVDNDFCKRLKLNGYSILIDKSVELRHQLGNTRIIDTKFFRHKFAEHSALRTYYMVRNNLFFIKKYRRSLNVCKEYMKLLYIIVNILLFSHQRMTHIKYIGKGWHDYMNNVMGEYKTQDCQ